MSNPTPKTAQNGTMARKMAELAELAATIKSSKGEK